MSRKHEALTLVTSWTNGRKAVVHLLEDPSGTKVIRKTYRQGFQFRMWWEYLMSMYVSRRTSITPRVVAFRPWRKEIFLEYLEGQRVLEWVLCRFGRSVNSAEFQSFHGLSPPDNVDPRVAEAFQRFRKSTSADVLEIKTAIEESYSALHRTYIKHGSADPRNVLYHQGRIFIIDFDNSRPSLNPAGIDNADLDYWYGIGRADQ